MKLFDFLKLLTTEKFPFKLEHVEWSNHVKVTVDTFSRIEIYEFDDSGITQYTELQEVTTTEDQNVMEQKLQELENRPSNAWIEAAADLQIKFVHPYKFIGVDGNEHVATGLLPDFGRGKGTLITSRKDADEVFIMADLSNDYRLSILNPVYYDQYDREQIINTLSDWGWIGRGERPDWMRSR